MNQKGRGRGPEITLQGGPYHGQRFWEEDLLSSIRAAKRFDRSVDDVRGWVLGYERPGSGTIWSWRARDCHPVPPD